MEIWTVVGVDTQATETIKSTGEKISGYKLHVYGSNFDPDQLQRYLGDCVSVVFVPSSFSKRNSYCPQIGERIRVAYDRWGRIAVLEPA